MYRKGHTRTVRNALQFEGFAPGPPPERRKKEGTNFGQPRWWTSYEWTLGGRFPTFSGRRIMNWQPLVVSASAQFFHRGIFSAATYTHRKSVRSHLIAKAMCDFSSSARSMQNSRNTSGTSSGLKFRPRLLHRKVSAAGSMSNWSIVT